MATQTGEKGKEGYGVITDTLYQLYITSNTGYNDLTMRNRRGDNVTDLILTKICSDTITFYLKLVYFIKAVKICFANAISDGALYNMFAPL